MRKDYASMLIFVAERREKMDCIEEELTALIRKALASPERRAALISLLTELGLPPFDPCPHFSTPQESA